MKKPLRFAETQLREKLEREGWKVIHQGWPDFVCIRNEETIFVEVKNYRGQMLKKEQHFILTHLAKLGLSCYKWTPDSDFEKIEKSTPMSVSDRKRAKFTGKRLTFEEKLARLWSQLSPEEREQYEKDKAAGREWFIA